MRTRIGAQMILCVWVVTVLAIAVMAALILPAHRSELIAQLTRSVDRLSETIKNSARDSMLENRRDRLHNQIQAIGRGEGIERIRLLNPEGRIMFSSDGAEIDTILDARAEGCAACPPSGLPPEPIAIVAGTRVFRDASGHRVLGALTPIENEPSCAAAACHAHSAGERHLGALDVTMSLRHIDREIARSQFRLAGLAALTLVTSGLLLWWLNRRLVVRPVEALAAGTRRVAEGDLTATIAVTARHELGDLARAFNSMVRRLSDAQRQLTQADKLASVGRLAAGVAHEINNPLTGVLTYASLLERRLSDDPAAREDLSVVIRETKRCREIVKGLLDFARQTPPRRQATDINEVVRRAVAVVMNQLAVHRVALTLDLQDDLPAVPADANQIQQVVVNLLLNAADAIGDRGGGIRVGSRRAALEPWGHAPIRRATCPRGCDLLDAETRIGGLPSIRVLRTCGAQVGPLRLDPVYGRFNHVSPEPCEEGTEMELACPACRVSLHLPSSACVRCGASTFAVQVPESGQVEWCSRNGCHNARWARRDARGPEPVVEIEVQDDGPGIPREALPHLFEPFFSTKGPRGTGLGLAVTWGIVEGHGGTIEVESEEARGSRFTVRLPLEPGESAALVAA